MYEHTITELRVALDEARWRCEQKQAEVRPYYDALANAENALMEQTVRQIADGGNFIVLAAQIHGVTEATEYEMTDFGRQLADRLAKYFHDLAYSVKWPDS